MKKGEALLGAAIAAFGFGCGEHDDGQEIRDGAMKDKDAKVEKAPADLVNRPPDLDFVVPGEDIGHMTYDVGVDGETQIETRLVGGQAKTGETRQESGVEIEKEFRNVLMEEADSIHPGDWMGEGYKAEVERLKKKLVEELWKNTFNQSEEQLNRFFAPRGDEKRQQVLCLIEKVKVDDDIHYVINKEYRDQVKKLAEKYGAQYGVPVEIIYSVMAVENGGKHDPRKNPADGAYGVMQVQLDVVKEMRRRYPNENWDWVAVTDLEGNIRTGTAYLKYLYGRYGQWSFALMAYNSGPGAFERRMAGGEEERRRIKSGWKKYFGDKNLWWACSKYGRRFCENGNAGYAVDAMLLGPYMYQIMESGEDEVDLHWQNRNGQ